MVHGELVFFSFLWNIAPFLCPSFFLSCLIPSCRLLFSQTYNAVPAGLATASLAIVHDIVRDQEESLEL